jgi:hypothetical protein
VATIRDGHIQRMEGQFDENAIGNYWAWMAQDGEMLA